MAIEFEWDKSKAKINLDKHGISFEEAATVFSDALSLTLPDPQHSSEEDRSVITDLLLSQWLLVVVHTERTDTVRIISARRATSRERNDYEQGNEEL